MENERKNGISSGEESNWGEQVDKKQSSKLQWPVMYRQTKFPVESKMVKKNKEFLKMIDKWKAKFG
ncbi:hypothetical protein [Psychrobacillus sp. MER TA 171]|uniref:hypothetical protein n=1 Tax=Psychrobacillus sp. MER TA 171 TaxID=2939577 RepID=UPI00203F603E|nr:hypothetical protein [Psychrobacillus sp. MER TA 171]MCM3359539.1 hypothetical protein [Psychrobacillus sp. MER TA 171]